MICPRCASNQSDDLNFCKNCGANLQAVRDALEGREKFDWGNTWLAEMFQSGQAAELHKLEMERRMGITPQVKRYNEIKAGVITSSVGIGLMIFLFIFMQGLVPNVSEQAANILSRVWIAGVIPFMVGMALIANGLVVSKRLAEIQENEMKRVNALDGQANAARSLGPADTSEFVPARFSVTEQTTRHLAASDPKPKQGDGF